jgi:Uma2 family endonuclease
MSTAPVRKYTPEEYLALERAAQQKSEYFRGEIFAMAGATLAHVLIVKNLSRRLDEAFEKSACLVLPTDMRVKCSTGLYTYPDVAIACGQPQFEDARKDTLLSPTCIIEVLSPSTEAYDRGKKFEHYRSIESLQEYVLIAQDRAAVETFVRPQTPAAWTWVVQNALDESLVLRSCNATIRIADVYAGVDFPPPTIADIHPYTVFPNGMPPR